MRVLGIDPGLTRCGIAVVDVDSARKLRPVVADVIRTPQTDALQLRINAVYNRLTELVAEYAPDAVAVERVFAQANVRTVMGTAQISGVAILLATQSGLPVATYTPTEVKAAVTGHGRADKRQVTSMVQRLLGLDSAPKPADAADALAIAICHAWRGTAQARLAAAAAKAGR